MKIQFKHQEYQADAVEAVADCFAGQPKAEGVTYRLDPGKLAAAKPQSELDYGTEAFRNAGLLLDEAQILGNIQKVQRRRNLPQSKALVATKSAAVNLDVEMETGTGKTYVCHPSEKAGALYFLPLRPARGLGQSECLRHLHAQAQR